MSSSSCVRWGILGTARIATKVAAAIHSANNADLVAVASRDADRAGLWADGHEAKRSYDSYEALLAADDIDAVYIPLPPSLHREWTIRAAEAGKHVLCEKPLALDASEAAEMRDACQSNNVQLMDGVMWRHHPRANDMLAVLTGDQLGPLRRVTSAFSFCWPEIPQNEFRLERRYGGGSLLDLGWYCVGATLWAFREMPTRVWGQARMHGDIDMHFSGQMWFGDERSASFDCGFDTVMRRWMEIAGTEGSLVCDDFTRPWKPEKPRFWVHGSTGEATQIVSDTPIQETCMVKKFSNIVQSKQLEPEWADFAVKVQRVCEDLDRSARSGEIVEVNFDR